MKITHGKSISPKPVHGTFSNKSWLVSEKGEQLTPKFKPISDYRLDGFVLYTTSVGHFLCHSQMQDIIYSDANPRADVSIQKVDEHMYKLVHYTYAWKVILFTQYGKVITDEYTCVRHMKNDLCAAEKKGRYGFIDGDANVIIPFKYKEVEDFNEYGYSIVTYDDGKMTVIDKKGNELFDPIDAFRMSFLSASLLKVSMKRAGTGVMNLEGKEIIPYVYSELWHRCGYIIVKYQTKYGLYTSDGQIEFECMYPEIIETPDKFVVMDFAKVEINKIKEVPKHT